MNLSFVFLLLFSVLGSSFGQVIISEFLYDRPGTDKEPAGEWIILQNTSESDVDLNGWIVTDGKGADLEAESGRFVFNDSLILKPQEKMILAYNVTVFKELHATVPETTKIIEYGSTAKMLKLNNEGDFIRLYNANGEIANAVYYGGMADKLPEEKATLKAPKARANQSLKFNGAEWIIVSDPAPGS